MPEFLRPGVFIIETSFRGKPIEGVATSTAGFVGRAQTGPEGKTTLVTSFTQFVREFGLPYSNPQNMGEYLGHAVQGFFDNGGLRAYIVRVLGAGAAPGANSFYRGNVLRLPSTTTVRGPTSSLPVTSLRGVHVGATIDVYTRASSSSAFALKYGGLSVTAYDAVTKTITLGGGGLPAGATLDPNNTYAIVDATPPAAAAGLTATAKNRGVAGNDIAIQFRPADLPPVKLATKSVVRAQPVIGSGITGPANGANTITGLSAAQVRQLRNGDTVKLDNGVGGVDIKTVDPTTGIGTATVNYGAIAAVTVTNGTLSLLNRGGGPDLTGGGDKLFNLSGAVNFGATSVTLPHAAAAMLQTGDKVVATDGGNTATFTVTTITFATSVKLQTNVSNNQNPTTVTLVNTAAPDATNKIYGRLAVADASSLTAPVRRNTTTNAVAQQPIVVTDGTNFEQASVVLVDTTNNVVYYDNNNTFTWSSLVLNSWTSAESLQVAKNGDTVINVSSTSSFYDGAAVRFDDGNTPQYHLVSSVDAGARTVTLDSGITVTGNNGYVDVTSSTTTRKAYLQVLEMDALIYDGGTVAETFSGLTWNSDAVASSYRKYYVNRINDSRSGSALVSITSTPNTDDNGDVAKAPATIDGYPENLINGSDGAAPTNIEIIGQDNGPGNRTGIQSLIEADDIAIVAVPGVTDTAVQGALITHCELLKYRFAVLDGIPNTSDVSAIQAHRNNYDTKYAAYYEPWLEKLDLTTGNNILVPPSGHVIGIYARSDNTRGVHKAPANEVVNNIIDLQYQFGNGEQEVLNPVGVNLIRSFTGRGTRVWGARTISSDQEWKYVNVRRLFIYLEHSIDNGTQWVVFEPNSESLWARVVSTISSFLTGVWKSGALMGTKPEEAFFVKCDRTTMTQDDIDNGRLVCLIGVAPVFPAEFVIFQIGQFTASSPA